MSIDPVILKLEADLRDYRRDLAGAQSLTDQKLDAIERRGEAMGQNIRKGFNVAAGSALAFAASLASAQIARTLIGIADEAKKLDAQLKLSTAGFGSFAQAQTDVRRIAEATRSGLSETASLYGNFARGAAEMGKTQEDAARATETFSKTLKISGADANQAASATLQFGQALASGALRGDELNSILEASPRLARLLAESMGTSIGQIKKLGEEGQLTSDKLMRALTDQKFTAGIDEEFGKLPVTFEQAMQRLDDAAMITFGAFDRGGEFSNALANFVLGGADGFGELEARAETLGITIRSTFEGLSNVFEPMLNGARALFGMIGGEAMTLADRIRPLFAEIDAIRNVFIDLNNKVATFDNKWLGQNTPIQERSNLAGAFDAGNNQTMARLGMQRIARGDPWADVPGMRPTRAPVAPRAVTRSSGGGGGRARSSGGGGRAAPAKMSMEDFAIELERMAADLARNAADLSGNINGRADAEKRRINADLAAERQRNGQNQKLTDEQRAQFNAIAEQTATARRALVDQKASEDLARKERDDREKQERLRSDALRDELDTLAAEADAADTLRERAQIERQILALQQEEERARLEAAIALEEVADAATARSNMKRRQGAETVSLERGQEGPGAQYMRSLIKDADELNDAYENVATSGLDALNNGLVDAIMGAKSLGDVFKGVANQIVADLLRIAIQQAVIKPLAGALFGGLGGGGGGGDGAAKLVGKIFAGIGGRASGGPVLGGQMYRVNEAGSPGNVEAFVPQGSGEIIPLGRMNAAPVMGQQGGGTATVRLELTGDIDARIQSVSAGVAVEVVKASAPGLIDASARETMARAGRPRI